MRIRHILTILLPAALIFSAGCSKEPEKEFPTGKFPVTVSATGYRLEPSGTKALTDLETDLIYAYPFSLNVTTALTGTLFPPYYTEGNNFTYLMPEPTQDIIFTNLLDGTDGWTFTTSTTQPLLTVGTDGTEGSDYDFVVGFLPESDMGEGGGTYPVDLRRKAARLSVNLRVKATGSEDLIADLSSMFSSISLSVNTYSTYQVNHVSLDGTGEAYSGETTMTWTNDSIPAGDTATVVYQKFILPATGEVLTLTLTSPSGYQKTLEASMSQVMSANRDYNLTLTLRQTGAGFDFNIDSFTEEDMDIEFGKGDLVTLSVTPSMLSIDMDTKAGNGDTYDGFVLGRDDLYLYCFSAQTDSLIHGYPIRQTSIETDSSYTFRMPQGSYRTAFMNMDVITPGSKFRIDTTSKDYLRYPEFRLKMDRKHHLETPLIEGHYDNIVNVTDSDVEIPVNLEKETTGYRVLLNLENPDSLVLSDIVKNMWISVSEFYDYRYPLESYDRNGSSSNTTFVSPILYPNNLQTAGYNGRTYLLLLDAELNTGGSPELNLDIITSDGQTKRLTQSISNFNIKGHHTIILTLNVNDIL